MLIETIEKNINNNQSKENKKNFLRKEIPLFIEELFTNKDVQGLEKLFNLITNLSSDLNKDNEISFLFSFNIFKNPDFEVFNSLLKNKKILNYFEDNSDILAHGIFTGDIKNAFSFYKRLKHPIFFSETNIYKYQNKFPIGKVDKFYKDLYQILTYTGNEEPIYLPYHIVNNAIEQKNVMLLDIGFSFLNDNMKLQKVFFPILWNIYFNNKLENLIFLETNLDLLNGINPCYADYLCEFLPEYLFQNNDELKFFIYALNKSQEHNKETVIMILNHLSKINLHFKHFNFIFCFHDYLFRTKNNCLYILEEIINSNGVIELVEIIKN